VVAVVRLLGQPGWPTLQHKDPAKACWTKNNSATTKAANAKLNSENNFVNDRLLGNRYNSAFILFPLFFQLVQATQGWFVSMVKQSLVGEEILTLTTKHHRG
jgi:hypothetical protein